jgi:hypothetical protein
MKSKQTRLRAWLLHAVKGGAFAAAAFGMAAGVSPQASAQSGSALIVNSDRGGKLGQRSREIRSLRAEGKRVELRGTCLSACTMYLSLPNVCVSSSARLGFHGPTRNGQQLSQREFDHWSDVMADNYREPLRSWFLTQARYTTSGYVQVSGSELIQMGYPQC